MHNCIVSLAMRYGLILFGKLKSFYYCWVPYVHVYMSLLCSCYLSSKRKSLGRKTLNLPLVGEVSIFSLAVLTFCLLFAIVWAANRKASYSWFGQDVLVSCHLFLLCLPCSWMYLFSWIIPTCRTDLACWLCSYDSVLHIVEQICIFWFSLSANWNILASDLFMLA